MKWCLLSGKVTDWYIVGTEQTPLHLLGHLWLTPFCRLGNSFKEIKWPAQGHRAVELSRQDSQPWMWCSECYTTFPSISHFHRLTISSRVFSSAETPNWVQPPFLKAQNWTWKNSSTLLPNLNPIPWAADSVTATDSCPGIWQFPPIQFSYLMFSRCPTCSGANRKLSHMLICLIQSH